MNRILAAMLLGAGLLIAGHGNGASDKYNGKIKERESTIDSCWQQKADSLLRNAIRGDKRIKGACVAVMNVWSGNIPAMVNIGRNAMTWCARRAL